MAQTTEHAMREGRIAKIVSLLACASDEFRVGHVADISAVISYVKAAYSLGKLVIVDEAEEARDGTH